METQSRNWISEVAEKLYGPHWRGNLVYLEPVSPMPSSHNTNQKLGRHHW